MTTKNPHHKINWISVSIGLTVIMLAFFMLISTEVNQIQQQLKALETIIASKDINFSQNLEQVEIRYQIDTRSLRMNSLAKYLQADINFKPEKTCQEIFGAKENKAHDYYTFISSLSLLKNAYQNYTSNLESIRTDFIKYEILKQYIEDTCEQYHYPIFRN